MGLTRRRFSRQFVRASLAAGAASVSFPLLGAGCSSGSRSAARRQARPFRLTAGEDDFLDDLCRTTFRFFREAAHPRTGHVLDRRRADGEVDSRGVASIAATGFGLTALTIADARGWAPRGEIREQVRRTLHHFLHGLESVHGFFYHFVDWSDGSRLWNCELSSIDTAILVCGALSCRAHFREDPEIVRLATGIYERVDWPWMLNGGTTFSMGWFPEEGRGFLGARWDHYCELMMLYLLALGSPTHPVGTHTWRAWSRPVREFYGERYVWTPAPLFAHQYSHAWFDFRGRRDAGVDWFDNSVKATRAHLAWSLDRQAKFPEWSRDLWGVTSSDSVRGYAGWGGPPDSGPLDGTIVPCAAAGSLPFLPGECLRTLSHQRNSWGDRIWKRYGFVDAFNPHDGWVNPDVLGIDAGITILMAENLRSRFVWRTMEGDPAVRTAWSRLGI
jgi:hypothetical protein